MVPSAGQVLGVGDFGQVSADFCTDLVSVPSRFVNSARKFTGACALMMVWGMNSMSNSLNSIDHFATHLDSFGFYNTCCRG